MDKKILQQIANTLYINVQQVNQPGLLQGKLGIAIFFFQYARHTGDKSYQYISDEIIENVRRQLRKETPKGFADGLTGIGWGIDYLLKHKFIDASGNVLKEFDAVIGEMDIADFKRELEMPIPLFSKGLYFVQRKNKGMIQKMIRQLDDFLNHDTIRQLPMLYINSIIYVLIESIHQGIFIDRCRRLMENLFPFVSQNIDNGNFTEDNAFFLQNNIINLQGAGLSKWDSLAPAKPTSAIHASKTCQSYWIDFLFPKSKIVEMEDVYTFDNLLSNIDYDCLSIYNGLAGKGLYYLQRSKAGGTKNPSEGLL